MILFLGIPCDLLQGIPGPGSPSRFPVLARTGRDRSVGLVLLTLLFPANIVAQAIPNAPTPHRIDYLADSLTIVSRTLDVISTERCVSPKPFSYNGGQTYLVHNCREAELPGFIANNPATMSAYSAGVAAGTIWAEHYLVRHRHPRLARWGEFISATATLTVALHNYKIESTFSTGKGGL